MKTLEKYISKQLTRLNYRNTVRCKEDIINALRSYKCLAPGIETYVFQDGDSMVLLNLGGTIPVLYKDEIYNIPVRIWILREYPNLPPLCYVAPTKDMEISVSPFVDHSGLVELPCISEWDETSTDISTLLQIARITFSENPPVFSKPKLSRRKRTEPDYESIWREHYPDSEEEEDKLVRQTLLVSAGETCRGKLGEVWCRTKAEIDSLHVLNRELIERQEKIGELVEMMKEKEEEVGKALSTLRVMEELMTEVQGLRSQQISSKDGEKMIFTESACQDRILETVAEDEAVNDSIYALGRALKAGQVGAEPYLRAVRDLSRDQFELRLRTIKLQQRERQALRQKEERDKTDIGTKLEASISKTPVPSGETSKFSDKKDGTQTKDKTILISYHTRDHGGTCLHNHVSKPFRKHEERSAETKSEGSSVERKKEGRSTERKCEGQSSERKSERCKVDKKCQGHSVGRKCEERCSERKRCCLERKRVGRSEERKSKTRSAERKIEEKGAEQKREGRSGERKVVGQSAERKIVSQSAERKVAGHSTEQKVEETKNGGKKTECLKIDRIEKKKNPYKDVSKQLETLATKQINKQRVRIANSYFKA
ncbi:tumor susceptibility gene 101 protein [Eurytemora carolleeae]|uniref:tumor susceptibility gene 101 protein n=1 Tax=Eurytemora carolleeae TaxID=1294199 RepID=UPI000C77894E|nr:tumor susceptibility gene 101 protein [Eurytemora carolleeae]|eukprot:XP_023321816.1 tumor susceptibility gene 101 protein-like [Eurytemora affinis]